MQNRLIDGGYILIARNIIVSAIWDKPPLYLKLWAWLLAKAQYRTGRGLKRGQIKTSISEMQEACSWHVGYRKEKPRRDQIFNIIDWLRNPERESDEFCEGEYETEMKSPMIPPAKATGGIVVTIVKYSSYQDSRNYEGNSEGDTKATVKNYEARYADESTNEGVCESNTEATAKAIAEIGGNTDQFCISSALLIDEGNTELATKYDTKALRPEVGVNTLIFKKKEKKEIKNEEKEEGEVCSLDGYGKGHPGGCLQLRSEIDQFWKEIKNGFNPQFPCSPAKFFETVVAELQNRQPSRNHFWNGFWDEIRLGCRTYIAKMTESKNSQFRMSLANFVAKGEYRNWLNDFESPRPSAIATPETDPEAFAAEMQRIMEVIS